MSWQTRKEQLTVWALGFGVEEQLVPHRRLEQLVNLLPVPKVTGSLLLGYLGQMCSHIQGPFMLGVNIVKIVEAQYSVVRLKFPVSCFI